MKTPLLLIPLVLLSGLAEAAVLNDARTIARACAVYCHGPLLEAVQLSGIFNDSKTFVDMPLRVSPEAALAEFARLNNSENEEVLQGFLSSYFLPPGTGDLVAATPPDWLPNPPLLDHIGNDDDGGGGDGDGAKWRKFAFDLNQIWPALYRTTGGAVGENPERYSLLRRRRGLVLPGGRFRETYYWDSYWIVRGLLVCGMQETASG